MIVKNNQNNNKERIQKIIANYGNYSRREAEKLISDKRVKVNGQLAKLGEKISISDEILIDNKKLILSLRREYYALNKPKGYISSKYDDKNKSVVSLINNYKGNNLFTIGRLDVQTTGLIIVTNDGHLSNYVMSPKNKIKKVYLVWYKNKLSNEDIYKLKNGIKIDEKFTTKKLVNFKIISNNNVKNCVKMSLIEGKNNQIRKMFDKLNNKVINLKRIQIENLKLNNIEMGKYKKYNKKEIYSLLNVKMED